MKFTYKFSAVATKIECGRWKNPIRYFPCFRKYLGDILIVEHIQRSKSFINELEAKAAAKEITRDFVFRGKFYSINATKKSAKRYTHAQMYYKKESTGHIQKL
jgi:hypothetical protein